MWFPLQYLARCSLSKQLLQPTAKHEKDKKQSRTLQKGLPRRVALFFKATRPTNLRTKPFLLLFCYKSQTGRENPPTLLPSFRLSSRPTRGQQNANKYLKQAGSYCLDVVVFNCNIPESLTRRSCSQIWPVLLFTLSWNSLCRPSC